MAKPVSWSARIQEIRRTVENSVRSHYTAREIEHLFKLQPRAARQLIGLIRTDRMGKTKLVERAALARFLDRAAEADDVSKVIQMCREEREAISRKRPRHLVRRDVEPVTLGSLPHWVRVREGRVEVDFATTQQLAEGMLMLARILENEGEEFAARFEPNRPARDESAAEVREMFRELEQMEAAHGRSTA